VITNENIERAIWGRNNKKEKVNNLGDLSLRMCVNTHLGVLDYDTVQLYHEDGSAMYL